MTTEFQGAARFNNEPLLLNPDYLRSSVEAVAAMEKEAPAAEKSVFETMEASYGVNFALEKDFAFADGLAFIPITGALLHRSQHSSSYVTGYSAIRAQLQAAMSDPEVRGIVYDVNSGGGDAAGAFELADEIRAERGKKPSIAVIDAHAYSAGYALASAAGRVVVTPSGGVGSIGVITGHVDVSKMYEEYGVKVTLVYAGKHKADGNPYEALGPAAKARMQGRVNHLYSMFTALVAQNRSLAQAVVEATEASTYSATEALDLGLVDAIASPQDALREFQSTLTKHNGDLTMSQQNTSAASEAASAAEAQASASTQNTADERAQERAQERARAEAIVTCEEAKDRRALAEHLAFKTDMSVEAAKAALAAAPAQSAQNAASVSASAFQAAMAQGNPNVGAEGGDTQMSAAQKILADFSAATGRKLAAVKH